MLFRIIYSLPFRIYQIFISPFFHFLFPNSGCRFKPTCSQVFITGIMTQGVIKGTQKGVTQLSQCHSFPTPKPFFKKIKLNKQK